MEENVRKMSVRFGRALVISWKILRTASKTSSAERASQVQTGWVYALLQRNMLNNFFT
jgi:hypothetical protein